MSESETITPEFIAAGEEYLRLSHAGGSQTPEAHAAFMRLYDLAPASFRREMHEKAVETGLLPAVPDAVDRDGNALYRLDKIAARAGISEEEALQMARQAGIVPVAACDAAVHPLH